jgi:hypothetical protein
VGEWVVGRVSKSGSCGNVFGSNSDRASSQSISNVSGTHPERRKAFVGSSRQGRRCEGRREADTGGKTPNSCASGGQEVPVNGYGVGEEWSWCQRVAVMVFGSDGCGAREYLTC